MNHTLQVLIPLSYLPEEPKVPSSDPDVYTDESHPQGHGENNENLQAWAQISRVILNNSIILLNRMIHCL